MFHLIGFSQLPEVNYKNYTVDHGLPSSEVYHVIQDKKGYLWFATDKGVSRFDGYQFKTFTTNNGLADNTIFSIYEDYLGKIWFLSLSGKLSYFINDTILQPDFNRELVTKIAGSSFFATIHVEKDRILLGERYGNMLYEIRTKGDSSAVNTIKSVSNEKLSAYLSQKKVISCQLPDQAIIFWRKNDWFRGYEAQYLKLNSQRSLIGYQNNIWEISGTQQKLIKSYSKNVISLQQDQKDNLWVSIGNSGVFLYPEANVDTIPTQFMDGYSVTSTLIDHENGAWFTTQEAGVFYLPSKAFLHYTQKQGLANNKVKSVTGFNDKVFIALEDGHVYTLSNDSLLPAIHNPIVFNRKTYVHDLIVDTANNAIWVASPFNASLNKRFYTWGEILKTPIHYFNSTALFQHKDQLLVGTHAGFFKHLPNEQTKTNVQALNTRIDAISEDEQGTIWIGNSHGLWRYENDTIICYNHLHPALNDRIVEIKAGKNNILWLGTLGNGVLLKSKDHIYQLTEEQGLLSNTCSSIFIDHDNTIWVASNKGISSIQLKNLNPLDYEIQNFNTTDGLISNDVYQVYRFQNKVWAATSRGLSLFNPFTTLENHSPIPLYITDVRINGEQVAFNNKITQLTHQQNQIKFQFIGLSYKQAGNLQYRYRLLGSDSTWTTTTQTAAFYAELSPGKYAFQVESKNHHEEWSRDAVQQAFLFEITPPFWLTWWFIVISSVMLTAISYYSIKLRISYVKRREKEKFAVKEAHFRELTSRLNPHFMFNALAALQYYITHNKVSSALAYLNDYAKLMRKVLENVGENYVSIEEEISFMEQYLELGKKMLGDKFDYQIHLEKDISIKEEVIPPLILYPYLENAILHGIAPKKTKGNIHIAIRKEKEILLCEIQDNGIGRELAKKRTARSKSKKKSLGMLINKERIRILNERRHPYIDVSISNLSDNIIHTGTVVSVRIPIKKQ